MNTFLRYETLNFNTFVNSLIFLFVVALNNDWPLLANFSILTNGSGNRRLMKFLFIFFKFFVNYILLNSIIAFMIEIFNEYDKKMNLKNKMKGFDEHFETDVLFGDEAKNNK